MKSRNPSVSANAEPAPLAGEPERVIPSRSRPEGKLLTFPFGEGGPPQRWKRGVTEESGAYLLAAPARNAPPQSR